jgi:hypothetical protein
MGIPSLALAKRYKVSAGNGLWGEGRRDVARGGVVYTEVIESNSGADHLQDLLVIEVSFTRRY